MRALFYEAKGKGVSIRFVFVSFERSDNGENDMSDQDDREKHKTDQDEKGQTGDGGVNRKTDLKVDRFASALVQEAVLILLKKPNYQWNDNVSKSYNSQIGGQPAYMTQHGPVHGILFGFSHCRRWHGVCVDHDGKRLSILGPFDNVQN